MAGSADLLADRTPEGLLPGSLATARGPAYGVNSVTTANHTLADIIARTHWNEGQLLTKLCNSRGDDICFV